MTTKRPPGAPSPVFKKKKKKQEDNERSSSYESLSVQNEPECVCLKGWLTEITFNACSSCQLVVIRQIRQ